MMRALALLLVLAAPAGAQADWRLDPALILDCLAAGGAESCIGLAARDCLAVEGEMARGLCLGEELLWWQERAGVALTLLAAVEPAVQDRARTRGVALPALAVIEADFARYRDAACAWREAQWDGLHHGFEWAECQVQLTARHALWLDALMVDA